MAATCSCDAGLIASIVALIASVFTLVNAIIYLIQKLEDITVEFSDCGIIEAECNRIWRSFFTFRPEIFFGLWTPFVFGFLGVIVHVSGLRVVFTQNYLLYAVFMVVNALFANIGYVGML